MKKRSKWRLSVVFVAILAFLAPIASADFAGGEVVSVNYVLDPFTVVFDATVDFVEGSGIPAGGQLFTGEGGVVNFYDCVFGAGSLLVATVGPNSPYTFGGSVTFHGTDFSVNGSSLTSKPTEIFLPSNTLSGKNANGDAFSVDVTCYADTNGQVNINLVWLDGPSVIDVVVDIKPDSADNTINLGSLGVIPVGILSTVDFDATTVDPWTVELAGAGVAVRGKGSKLLSSAKDLNGDGLLDLEVKVETENLDPGQFQDGAASLTGQTYDGLEVQGSDSITIVPE
jgi:hypothetical protein